MQQLIVMFSCFSDYKELPLCFLKFFYNGSDSVIIVIKGMNDGRTIVWHQNYDDFDSCFITFIFLTFGTVIVLGFELGAVPKVCWSIWQTVRNLTRFL